MSSDKTSAERIDLIIRDIAELPDRTSPDDWPEVMLVTPDELRSIIQNRMPDPPRKEGYDKLRELHAEVLALLNREDHTSYTDPHADSCGRGRLTAWRGVLDTIDRLLAAAPKEKP